MLDLCRSRKRPSPANACRDRERVDSGARLVALFRIFIQPKGGSGVGPHVNIINMDEIGSKPAVRGPFFRADVMTYLHYGDSRTSFLPHGGRTCARTSPAYECFAVAAVAPERPFDLGDVNRSSEFGTDLYRFARSARCPARESPRVAALSYEYRRPCRFWGAGRYRAARGCAERAADPNRRRKSSEPKLPPPLRCGRRHVQRYE